MEVSPPLKPCSGEPNAKSCGFCEVQKREEGMGVGERKVGVRAAVAKLNNATRSSQIIFWLNLFVVPFSFLPVGIRPLKRETSLSLHLSVPLTANHYNSSIYCRSSFLYCFNNAFASVTTCSRDLVQRSLSDSRMSLGPVPFDAPLPDQSSLSAATCGVPGRVSTASLRLPFSITLASVTMFFAAFPLHNQLAHSFDEYSHVGCSTLVRCRRSLVWLCT
ncbi:hypothetical protein EI94DRAFT_827235 [Lactarius quietus]|nr:hypothetical protein EI94DRAFT_827235 [Lactarius quietus]